MFSMIFGASAMVYSSALRVDHQPALASRLTCSLWQPKLEIENSFRSRESESSSKHLLSVQHLAFEKEREIRVIWQYGIIWVWVNIRKVSIQIPSPSPGPQDMVKLLLHSHFRPQAVWTDIAGPWWTSRSDPLTGPWPLLCGLEPGRR